MPHKLYQCCDRNSCDCGKWEKTFSSNYNTEKKEKKDFSNFSTKELENEVKKRKNKEIHEKIDSLRKELEDLESKLV